MLSNAQYAEGVPLKRGIVQNILLCLLAGALFISFYASTKGLELPLQLMCLGLIFVCAFINVFVVGITGVAITPIKIVIYLICITSIAISMGGVDNYSAIYSSLFLFTFVCVNLIASNHDDMFFLDASSLAFVVAVIAAIVTQFQGYVAGLNAFSGDHWANRFTPFGMHPNLTGLCFGGGALTLYYKGFVSSGRLRVFFYIFALMSASIIWSASARASCLALCFSSALMIVTKIHRINLRVLLPAAAAGIIFAVFCVFYFDLIARYTSSIFELDSETRGINSGGSGRFDLWARGIELALGDSYSVLTGLGFRNASVEKIGFYTENSYITILIEFGVPLGCTFIFLFLLNIGARTIEHIRMGDAIGTFCLHYLLFVAIESVFNRYLLGMGNPASLLTLFYLSTHKFKSAPEIPIIMNANYSRS